MSGLAVYGELKREMWRETVGYLENYGAEHGRDFVIAAKVKEERELAERKVKQLETIRSKL